MANYMATQGVKPLTSTGTQGVKPPGPRPTEGAKPIVGSTLGNGLSPVKATDPPSNAARPEVADAPTTPAPPSTTTPQPASGTGFNAATPGVVQTLPEYARKDDSVTSALTDIMSKDSPLMRQATTAGLQTANRRGLLNSSTAVQASQDAAYTAALPIASQQASQAATENLANLDASNKVYLQGRAEEQAKLDRDLQEKLAKWNLDESQRATAAQTVISSQQLYTDRINNIMANTNLSSKDRTAQLNSAKAFYDTQMSLVQQMFTIKLSW